MPKPWSKSMVKGAKHPSLKRMLERPYRAAPLATPLGMLPSLPQQVVTDIRQAVEDGRMTPEDGNRAIRALRR